MFRRRSPIKALVAAIGAILVFACETTAPPGGFPQLSFAHLPPIALDVARIEIVNEFRSPGTKPNVEHLFPVKPSFAADRWGRDRLKAAGNSGVARMTIRRASVVEVSLPRTTGIKGMLTTDQSERYDGVIEIAIAVLDSGGRQRGAIASRAQRSKSVPESVSLYEREKVWFKMVEAMMNDLNGALETQIKTHLGKMLR